MFCHEWTAGSQPGPGAAPLTYLFPLPPEYERALHKKLTMTAELRQRFRAAGLTKEREAELNNAIQAYFKVCRTPVGSSVLHLHL
jgi:TBCC domain-containing protein 1